LPALTNSHPPITAMATSALSRINAPTGLHGGPPETFGGQITGTAVAVCLAL
jgi:hypothetical protein